MKSKLKKIYFYFVKKIFDLMYGRLIPSNDIHNINYKTELVSFNHNNQKKFKIYKISNSRIYSDLSQNVAIIKDNIIYENLSTQIENNILVEIKKNKILQTGTRKRIQKKIKGNVLSLVQGISAIENYGHWMLDTIPKICIANRIKKIKDFDSIIFPNVKKRFQIDTLKYLDLHKSQIIDGSFLRHVHCENLFIPKHPYWEINQHQYNSADNISKELIMETRNFFFKNKNLNKPIGRRIFIDRSDSKFKHNQLSNNEEIKKILVSKGFKILKLSEFSLDEQINLFYNSEVIIGAHGAGLTNIIFCNKNTKIFEIENPKSKSDLFKNISNYLELDYTKIKSLSSTDSKNSDITLDSDYLLNFKF